MAVQLPAHLQNRPYAPRQSRASDGIGSAMPPHISIQSNQFALIDASGAVTEIETPFLDVCVIDWSDVICKMFFGKAWEPGSTDPPLCFSMNGIGPSKDAVQPQARTCAECPNNERGSAVSKMTGASIKACRDERKLAVLVDGFDMVFQMTITPGHFTNWRGYDEKFKGQQFQMDDVWTRLTFERGKTGVLAFNARPQVAGGPSVWIDEKTVELRNEALTTKKTDLYVGRLDRPREGGLPAPAARPQVEQQPARQITQQPENRQEVVNPQVAQQAPQQAQQAQQAPQQAQQAQQAPAEAQPARRRRRTQAEMAAASQQAPQQAQQAPQQAPFRETQAPIQNGSGAPFGIQQGVEPSPELASTIDSIFGPA